MTTTGEAFGYAQSDVLLQEGEVSLLLRLTFPEGRVLIDRVTPVGLASREVQSLVTHLRKTLRNDPNSLHLVMQEALVFVKHQRRVCLSHQEWQNQVVKDLRSIVHKINLVSPNTWELCLQETQVALKFSLSLPPGGHPVLDSFHTLGFPVCEGRHWVTNGNLTLQRKPETLLSVIQELSRNLRQKAEEKLRHTQFIADQVSKIQKLGPVDVIVGTLYNFDHFDFTLAKDNLYLRIHLAFPMNHALINGVLTLGFPQYQLNPLVATARKALKQDPSSLYSWLVKFWEFLVQKSEDHKKHHHFVEDQLKIIREIGSVHQTGGLSPFIKYLVTLQVGALCLKLRLVYPETGPMLRAVEAQGISLEDVRPIMSRLSLTSELDAQAVPNSLRDLKDFLVQKARIWDAHHQMMAGALDELSLLGEVVLRKPIQAGEVWEFRLDHGPLSLNFRLDLWPGHTRVKARSAEGFPLVDAIKWVDQANDSFAQECTVLFPVFKEIYAQLKNRADQLEVHRTFSDDCPICLEVVFAMDVYNQICETCSKIFHRPCLKNWLSKNLAHSCPMCRAHINMTGSETAESLGASDISETELAYPES